MQQHYWHAYLSLVEVALLDMIDIGSSRMGPHRSQHRLQHLLVGLALRCLASSNEELSMRNASSSVCVDTSLKMQVLTVFRSLSVNVSHDEISLEAFTCNAFAIGSI